MLGRGELRCIGATTLDEYRTHIEKDPALGRAEVERFQSRIESARGFRALKYNMSVETTLLNFASNFNLRRYSRSAASNRCTSRSPLWRRGPGSPSH